MDEPRQGWESAAALFAEDAREAFGGNLAGVYLHGSAAMGCWNPAKSDLDLIVVVQDSPDDACKRAFMERSRRWTQACPGRKGIPGSK